jgi:predicted phosphate transport protein (TIGR00153 family)
MAFFKNATNVINAIETFFNTIDEGVLVFKEGVTNYLHGNQEAFNNNIANMAKLEADADNLRRDIENKLYAHSLMPQVRGDILRLLEEMDNIIDTAKKNLFQFDVEVPNIPAEMNQDLILLTDMCVSSVSAVIPAARAYFRTPETVKDMIHRVYFYEKEADKLADAIKRKVFRQMTGLRLSEKFHLRYFTLHIETVSDTAEKVADLLSIMAIKRTI